MHISCLGNIYDSFAYRCHKFIKVLSLDELYVHQRDNKRRYSSFLLVLRKIVMIVSIK